MKVFGLLAFMFSLVSIFTIQPASAEKYSYEQCAARANKLIPTSDSLSSRKKSSIIQNCMMTDKKK